MTDALHARDGCRRVEYRFDILRDGIPAGTLDAESASLACNKDDAINRSMQIVVRSTEGLDLLSDRIRPIMRMLAGRTYRAATWREINAAVRSWRQIHTARMSWRQISEAIQAESWDEYPMGVFIPTTPTYTRGGGARQAKIECYDVTVVLREDCITERLFFAVGTEYLDAVTQILLSAGIGRTQIVPSAKTLLSDREFEIGTSKLDICNTLLSEINYNPVRSDANGAIVLTPYVRPTMAQVMHEYRADELSIIAPEITEETDLYNVPNVFIAVVSNPDLDEDLVSTYVNDDPASPLSTVRRGRRIVSNIYQPDAIASQEDLDNYIGRIAFEASQIYQTAEISTAVMPDHGTGDTLLIDHPELSGVFEEIGWSAELKQGGKMTHNIRRLVTA